MQIASMSADSRVFFSLWFSNLILYQKEELELDLCNRKATNKDYPLKLSRGKSTALSCDNCLQLFGKYWFKTNLFKEIVLPLCRLLSKCSQSITFDLKYDIFHILRLEIDSISVIIYILNPDLNFVWSRSQTEIKTAQPWVQKND